MHAVGPVKGDHAAVGRNADDLSSAPRRIASSSAVLLVENVVRLVAVALISFWIARQLGPEQFGVLNSASALVAILLAFAGLGMDTPVILRLARTARQGVLMGTVLLIRSAAGLAILAVAATLVFQLRRGDATAMHVTLIISTCVIAEAPTVLDYWFKAKTMALPPALARTTATLTSALAKSACLLLGLGVIALAWTVLLEALAAALLITLAYVRHSRTTTSCTLSIDRGMIRPLLSECRPYLLSTVAVVAYLKIDVVMLAYMSSDVETGIYSLAQKMSEVLYLTPVILVDSAFPILAKRFIDEGTTKVDSGQMLFDLAVGGALISSLAALALAKPLVDILFGYEYKRAVDVFYLHSWSCIAIAMNYSRYRWMAVVGLQRYAPRVTTLGLLANVALNFMLIPRFGAAGAAMSTVTSYFLSAYLLSLWLPPLREIGMMQTRALWPWSRLYRAKLAWRDSRLPR